MALSIMKSTITKNLFREILDCPRVMSASGQCSSIILLQNRCNFQVPEPWNGDIENAKILILGLNPALDVAELFPSYDLCSGAWNVMCAKGYKWTDPVVETFFEDRYSACCPPCGLQYADVNANPVKILSKSCVYKTAKNPFWKTVIAYASAVTKSSCAINDLVFSDCIHCKSSNGAGCDDSVKNNCMNKYFQRVMSVFITSGATDSLFSSAGVQKQTRHSSNQVKTILLVGKKSSTVLPMLSSGLTVISKTHIGNYNKSYNKSNIRVPITEHVFSIGGHNIKIVDGLPLPSGANRSCRNVEINNIKIPNW